MTREEVYELIDVEREYQDRLWETSQEGGEHSETEFLVYIRDYVEEALHTVSRIAAPACWEKVMANVRKIAALAVACMEQHDAPERDLNDLERKRVDHGIKPERHPRYGHLDGGMRIYDVPHGVPTAAEVKDNK